MPPRFPGEWERQGGQGFPAQIRLHWRHHVPGWARPTPHAQADQGPVERRPLDCTHGLTSLGTPGWGGGFPPSPGDRSTGVYWAPTSSVGRSEATSPLPPARAWVPVQRASQQPGSGRDTLRQFTFFAMGLLRTKWSRHVAPKGSNPQDMKPAAWHGSRATGLLSPRPTSTATMHKVTRRRHLLAVSSHQARALGRSGLTNGLQLGTVPVAGMRATPGSLLPPAGPPSAPCSPGPSTSYHPPPSLRTMGLGEPQPAPLQGWTGRQGPIGTSVLVLLVNTAIRKSSLKLGRPSAHVPHGHALLRPKTRPRHQLPSTPPPTQ
ncbi:uncharacterized protein LOC110345594 [Heterocephalus glaber]|uniref:Uncharacterized protein LOC110345594 n=1 Tax=Heterocephalus glaber TaxID=10181 RepID=A0AAX6RMV1_HETGA|nr:uncharacterized protein LOC110345594 [Heterocephalus glaber]XP_021099147.1 uncharacterized protein LOC110345594 [Heterocephalus glaber]